MTLKEYMKKGMEYYKAEPVKVIVIAIIVLGAVSALVASV